MVEVVNWFCAPRTIVAMALRYASLKDRQSFTSVGLRDDLSQAEKNPLCHWAWRGLANSDSESSDHQSASASEDWIFAF